jgi:DNA-binding transcriptional ArsR family regulator
MQPFGCIFSAVDNVFKALADKSRRALLDQLYQHNGQTLGQLCQHLEMTRQAVSKHLRILGRAQLVIPLWRGREKLHFLNPAPLKEISERWVGKYPKACLHALTDLETALDGLASAQR